MNTSMRIQFPTNEKIVRIGRVTQDRHYRCIMMMPLNKKNEENIKQHGYITDEHDNIIEKAKILFYGSVDPNDETDRAYFNDQHFIWCDVFPGSFIPMDFDYETSTGGARQIGIDKFVLTLVETLNPWRMFLYGHCRLGKPAKIVVFEKLVLKRKSEILAI